MLIASALSVYMTTLEGLCFLLMEGRSFLNRVVASRVTLRSASSGSISDYVESVMYCQAGVIDVVYAARKSVIC